MGWRDLDAAPKGDCDSCDTNIKASSQIAFTLALRFVDLALFLQQEHQGSTDSRRLCVFVEHFNLLHSLLYFLSCHVFSRPRRLKEQMIRLWSVGSREEPMGCTG